MEPPWFRHHPDWSIMNPYPDDHANRYSLSDNDRHAKNLHEALHYFFDTGQRIAFIKAVKTSGAISLKDAKDAADIMWFGAEAERLDAKANEWWNALTKAERRQMFKAMGGTQTWL